MLDIALKEWQVVVRLLLAGKFALLLRKGGIHEHGGPGVFTLEHPRFALFPSWLHQRPEMLKAEWHSWLPPAADLGHEPARLDLAGWGEAAHIWQIPSRAHFDRLEDLHPWSQPQVDMRFAYKPDRPIYLLALRAYRLPRPANLANTAAYGGCKSWVPLNTPDQIDETGSTPALSNEAFAALHARVTQALS